MGNRLRCDPQPALPYAASRKVKRPWLVPATALKTLFGGDGDFTHCAHCCDVKTEKPDIARTPISQSYRNSWLLIEPSAVQQMGECGGCSVGRMSCGG